MKDKTGTEACSNNWHVFYVPNQYNIFTKSIIFSNKNNGFGALEEVRLYFVWVAYLTAVGYSMREAVWINIDETPIPLHFSGKRGHRMTAANATQAASMRDQTSLQSVRGKCTFMAAITTDRELQQKLPQVLLPNAKGMKKKWDGTDSKRAAYPTIQILKDTSGWMTNQALDDYFDILHEALLEAGIAKVVLVMDCHQSHYSIKTLRKLRKFGWRVLFVPAKLTFLLQPLDAYVFSRFKREFHTAGTKNRIMSPNGRVTFEQWVDACFATITDVFSNMHAETYFQKCGCDIPSNSISASISRHVQSADLGKHRKLTADELHFYSGVRSDVHLRSLFRDNVPHDRAAAAIALHTPTHRLRTKQSSQRVA